MKKVISAVLIAAVLLCFGACNFGPEAVPKETEEPVFQTQAAQKPMVAVALPTVTEEKSAQDGTLLLRTVYQNMELTVPDPEVAERIIVDFLNYTDLLTATNVALLKQAAESYVPNSNFSPYLSQIVFTPRRIDQGILSLYGEYVEYKGSAHPEVNPLSLTYDMTTGQAVTSSEILVKGSDEQLLGAVLGALINQQDILYEGYEDTVKELFLSKQNWYLSEEGIVFYYSPYEIAPYSAGVVTATVPYQALSGILNDAYFPREKDTLWGEIKVLPFTPDNTARFTQSAEVVCGEGNAQAIIYTDGTLESIYVELINEQNCQTVIAAHTLTPGDAIIIHGEAGQEYNIQYKTEDGTDSCKLTFTPDGTPSLS